ncbi:MAG TPA: sigma-54 dependent transcriptional regulator [Bacteroidota bacterium]|nr:sigma-54 dependent transcriptional regulator [Bacteroidota bacterium]
MSSKIFPTDPVLLVDDEEHFLLSAELTLSSNGINNTETCADSRNVMALLEKKPYSLVALDMNMQYVSGMELLKKIIQFYPHIPVVMITAINDVDSAVLCIKEGAFDYVVKPVNDTKLVTTIKRGLELTEIRSENELLKQSLFRQNLEHPDAFNEIVTHSATMRSIFRYIEAIAKTILPVLITGETGTGKELFARAVHTISGRKGELVTVNVAGVDDDFFSDTLFGHKKGAFTGAEGERMGLIERADQGTLFLDEIGDLSIESQVKLLRLLQDGSYYPLGSDMAKLSDARIIVATHRDVAAMQTSDSFRQDLYYRLKSHHISIPPLRERKSDLPLLIDHFMTKAATSLAKKRPTVPKEFYTLLANYDFPGNVRELEGMIFDAVSVHKSGVLSLDSIRKKIADRNHGRTGKRERSYNEVQPDELLSFPNRFPTLQEAEDALIAEALRRAEGNQTIAAELLGISRRALNNRLRRLENDPPET